jgi:hypothetical protein
MEFKIGKYLNDLWYICTEVHEIGAFEKYKAIDYLHKDFTLHDICGSKNMYGLEEAIKHLKKWGRINNKVIELKKSTANSYIYLIKLEDFITEEEFMI